MIDVAGAVRSESSVSQFDLLRRFLEQITIIDYGVIVAVRERQDDADTFYHGLYVDVRLLDNRIIQNVEMLFIGSGSVIAPVPVSGDRVLLFGTKRDIVSVETLAHARTGVYGDDTVKALGIGGVCRALTKLLLNNGITLYNKNGAVGVSDNGDIFSVNSAADGTITREEVYHADGSFVKRYHGGRAVAQRSADFTNEWALYTEDLALLEYEKRDMAGNHRCLKGEHTTVNEEMQDKKWKYEETEAIEGGYTTTKIIRDADDKILYKRVYNVDGSIEYNLYERSAGGGDFLITQVTQADGSYRRTVTDGAEAVCAITIDADGTVKGDVGNGGVVFELSPGGAVKMTLQAGLTLDVAGDVAIRSKGALEFTATAAGKLTIGNAIATLGELGSALLDALKDAVYVGSPAQHTSPSLAAFAIKQKILWEQVFK
jgi:hypothetical protein